MTEIGPSGCSGDTPLDVLTERPLPTLRVTLSEAIFPLDASGIHSNRVQISGVGHREVLLP